MLANDFQLWTSLYAASAVCCALALVLSVLRVGVQEVIATDVV